MPTKRTRRSRCLRKGLTPFQRAYLLDQPLPEPDSDDLWWAIVEARAHEMGPPSGHYERSAGYLWMVHREQLLSEFVTEHPGRRPRVWWEVDAPRQSSGGRPVIAQL
jgi:hypothetical protein